MKPDNPNGACRDLCDLHIHTTASDGTVAPDEIVRIARKHGVRILAITDHDTTVGNAIAVETGDATGVTVIPGIEISVAFKEFSMHMLGLGLYNLDPELADVLSHIRKSRRERNPGIIRKLNLLGFPITMKEVSRVAGGEIIGRPHIARVMIEKGFPGSYQDIFDRFLRPGAAAYTQRYRPNAADAIRLIIQSGGLPVLAHPGLIPVKSRKRLEGVIAGLAGAGLRGIEINYPLHSPSLHEFLIDVAQRHNLMTTGGSDFHGANKPESRLGHGTGGMDIPVELGERVLEALPNRPSKCLI